MAGIGCSGDKTGSPELQSKSWSTSMHVPGAAASTYHGVRIFHSLLRHLLKSKSRLGGFARSFVTWHSDRQTPDGTAPQELFPLPLPYPEVLWRKPAEEDKRMALKKGVAAVVIVLNYLHFNRPRTWDVWRRERCRLSKKQWEAVKRLEFFMEAWVEFNLVTPEIMGRTAGKVETLEGILSELETCAASLAKSGGGYFDSTSIQKKEPTVINKSSGFELSSNSMCTFKAVQADRLSFVGRPKFDPTPFLDPLSQQIFNDPLGQRVKPEQCRVKPPRLRVHCSRHEKVKLFELLDASDRLRIHLPSEVTPFFGSGLFSVTKDLSRDRLILDSRGANLLEQPPQRWIRSLASAESLTRLTLEDDFDLACSGNDLRDFYYLFRASSSRSRRNVLVGAMNPKELQHLSALKQEHLKSPVVYGSLASLAMGDCQAVELAQSCHLGLGLQHDIITADNLCTMYKPLPRESTLVGLVIDDFITISKVRKDRDPTVWSEGARLAERMQDVYEDVDLIPNKAKGFRDNTESSFWGIDLDGRRGLLRGSLKRAIPLAGIMLKLATIGYATSDLLQVVVGSLISLFLFRRRFLSLLDSLLAGCRRDNGREVFRLDGRTISDVLMLIVLLPLAVTNLRAQCPSVLGASDASNWGEAGVVAKIPPRIGQELLRHVLRKSVWSRLLGPTAAVLRSHGLLPEDEELPGEEDRYQQNALWSLLAQCLEYQLLFAKQKSGQRHINIGELRAGLKTEKILGSRKPCSRILVGMDSQVALGAIIKGRSASAAMNAELVRSIPNMLLLDTYLDTMYFNTSENRADQPTRGKEIEPPAAPLPKWWSSLSQGDTQAFDLWLFERGLDAESMSGLPPLDELCGDVSPDGILPNFLRSELQPESCPEIEHSATGGSLGLPSSTSSAQPLRRTADTGRPNIPSVDAPNQPEHHSELKDPFESEKAAYQTTVKQDSSAPSAGAKAPGKGRRRMPPRLSKEAIEALSSFPKEQFELGAGVQWPPQHAGFLDLFSGQRGVAKSLARTGNAWSLCFDLADSPAQDLSDPCLRSRIERLITLGCFLGVGGGPVCCTFSMAVRPPVRSSHFPYGLPTMTENMKVKVAAGNDMALWMFGLLDMALELHLAVWLENPNASWMFRLPAWKSFFEKWKDSLGHWTVDYCRFHMPWRKRTKFYSNTALRGHRTLCSGGHEHQLLKGYSPKFKKSWTKVAEAYPKGVAGGVAAALALYGGLVDSSGSFDPANCSRTGHLRIGEAKNPGPRVAEAYPKGVAGGVAAALALYGGLVDSSGSFDPANCSRTGHLRIGEAKNPGPRAPRTQGRNVLLESVPLVEPRTLALQSKIWEGFAEWLALSLSPGAIDSAMAQPHLLVLLAKEYGNFLYASGKSLFVYRHFLVFLQQNFVLVKPYMSDCWNLITKWEIMEPTEHRVPLPWAIYRAMLTVSIGWGWLRFAAMLILAFLGICRPGEPLVAFRSELVLPRDMLDETQQTAYLKILKPKTRRRGKGVVQHISLTDGEAIQFLDSLYKDRPKSERLFDCSASAFRRRWDAILKALSIPKSAGLTPGGIRGGGCVYAFQTGTDLPRLLWKMRIKHLQTLESYLQECSASTVVCELPASARDKIRSASALASFLLARNL